MRYIPSSPEIEKKMLDEIGVKSLEELLEIIPKSLRVKSELGFFEIEK